MKNSAVRYGIFGGVSVVTYFLAFYFAKPQLMLEPAVVWASVVMYLVFMFLATRQERKAQGDESYTFKQALRTAFLTFVIINTIYYLFNFLLYRVDPTMLIYQKEMIVRNMKWMSEWLNQADNHPVSVGNMLFSLLRSFIFGFIIALPVAALARR